MATTTKAPTTDNATPVDKPAPLSPGPTSPAVDDALLAAAKRALEMLEGYNASMKDSASVQALRDAIDAKQPPKQPTPPVAGGTAAA